MLHVRPQITVMTGDQIARIHDHSLHTLASVGVRVDSDDASRLLGRAGAEVEDGRVRIPADLVQWALDAAPSRIDIHDRLGRPAFHLAAGAETRFGIGVTALNYQDPATDEVVEFQGRHMESMVRLGEALPSFDAISTVGILHDVGPDLADLYATLEMVANSTKPLVLLVSQEESYPAVLDLLEELHPDLAARPFVVPYFNPVTPLVINTGTIDKMRVTIERGLPFIYSNYGMAGATTPITPAGALVVLNAELLAGLVLSQLMKEGTPVILGILPAFFDMRGMANFYDPLSYLLNLACAEMMAFYGLPHCGTSGSGMGWGGDVIVAGHLWTNHLLSCLGKVGLAPFVGDNLGSTTFSPAVIVLADEIIAQTRRLASGFAIDEASVALADIAEVGPGGNFLMASSTLEHFRTAYFQSVLFPNLTIDDWRQQNCPRAEDRLRSRTRDLLDGLTAPEDHDELIARGATFIDSVAG
jgi:trimethylamine--corrinoid protein Co-methyltransferase